ncbi:hypothetical protein AAFC00_000922 [Neodothiora populina]|uniref:Uncharacterized protein n=1 Tax=Neodothiora populina TaxID=2781224 RepID=A0ABR3PM70_9PEZI
MSAEDLGKRLLGEVVEERLDELLSTLRFLQDPKSQYHVGISQIDHVLDVIHASDHPAARLRTQHQHRGHQPDHSRVIVGDDDDESNPRLSNLLFRSLAPGLSTSAAAGRRARHLPPLIELTSPSPNDGKTQLLYYFIAVQTLPTRMHNKTISLKGQGNSVVYIDTESRFSVHRVVEVMRCHIEGRIREWYSSSTRDNDDNETKKVETMKSRPTVGEIESVIEEALRHVHVFQPQSLDSLLATLEAIPAYLFPSSSSFSSTIRRTNDTRETQPPPHFSHNRKLGFLALDSASSFYWQDKAAQEGEEEEDEGPEARQSKSKKKGYTDLALSLHEVSTRLHAPVIYTTWNLSRTSSSRLSSSSSHTSSLLATGSITAQQPFIFLSIHRRPVRKFPLGLSIEEAFGQQLGRGRDWRGAEGEAEGRKGDGDVDRRERAVARGGFDVSISSSPGSLGGRDGGFEVWIGEGGVEIRG